MYLEGAREMFYRISTAEDSWIDREPLTACGDGFGRAFGKGTTLNRGTKGTKQLRVDV